MNEKKKEEETMRRKGEQNPIVKQDVFRLF